MKKYLPFLFISLLLFIFYTFAQAVTSTVKGRVIDLLTNKGIPNVSIAGLNVPSGTKTDTRGGFSFTPLNPSSAAFIPFAINAPAPPSGFNAIFASDNNTSNFWETSYLSQVAGLRCRSESAFCSKDEVWRDKDSSSKYDFIAEQAVNCTSASSTSKIIRGPAGLTDAEPGVASDGSKVVVAIRVAGDNTLSVNESNDLGNNIWNGWIDIGGQLKSASSPAPRALGKDKFAIFVTWQDNKTRVILRDKGRSRTPFVEESDVSPTPKQVTLSKGGKFQFSKTSDGKVRYQLCT